jgi:DNA polymerase-1
MTEQSSRTPTLFLIDSLSLIFQAFYAVRNLTNLQGVPTGAVYGFTRRILQLLNTYKPTHLVACFEGEGPTFRHKMYEAYKSNRVETPAEFKVQIPYTLRVLEAMGIPSFSCPGYEADDVIGTLATRASKEGMRTVIVSADKDLFQLVDANVSMLRSRKDDMQTYGPADVKARLGVMPNQVVDYLAIVGDTSDFIPGVPGLGEKSAVKLLEEFGSLDGLLEGLDRVSNARWKKLLSENIESARMSYDLAKIECDVPVPLMLEDTLIAPRLQSAELMALYQELGFTSLLKEFSTEPAPVVVSSEVRRPDGEYRVVWDQAMLQEVVESIVKEGRVAFDTETDAIDSMRARLVGISLCCHSGTAWYIPVGHALSDADNQLSLDTVREILGPVLADGKIAKIAQNAKYDLRVLRRHGFEINGLAFDTMLASYVLNPEERHGLKAMALSVLGITMTEIDELIGKGKTGTTMDQVEVERAAPYACADADMTFRLADVLGGQLDASGLRPLFDEIEVPLVEVLDTMECEGVRLDLEVLRSLSKDLEGRLAEKTREIFALSGRPFNIKSPKQVAEILFDELGLTPKRRTATGPSTSVDVLEDLAGSHPLPDRILEFRHLDKIKSTYVDALPLMVNPETGKVHTSYNQFVAATGRLSSSDPNLQNIPVRSVLGREIRRAFVPNAPGEVFLAADYSQIELRILAHVTGDAALRRAFTENVDIHTQTAARVFGMPAEMVTEDMRSQAKVINFGILYGMTAHRLSRELDISRGQAQRFIDEYFAAYPRVREWSDAVVAEARKSGCVTTLSGRRRMIRDLDARNAAVRQNAERRAVNTPIQGTSADMIKIAMVALHREMAQSSFRARMVLQVHDELVFTLPESEVEAFTPLVRKTMEEALPLEVPVRVDVKVGRTWAEC